MKAILERLQAMERLMPSLVTVTYPDGTQTVVEALKAFEIAVNNRGATFSVPNNRAMENLLRAVADAVGI
jgi:squalene cyclase